MDDRLDLGKALRDFGTAFMKMIEPTMTRVLQRLDDLIGRVKRKSSSN